MPTTLAPLPTIRLATRRAVFRALVEAQDDGLEVADSRAAVAERFGLTVGQVAGIEEEGVAKDWPLE